MVDQTVFWRPSADDARRATITAYADWVQKEYGHAFDGYEDLWQWSVRDLEDFWLSVATFFGVPAAATVDAENGVLGDRSMPGAKWFPALRLNYAERVLTAGDEGDTAILYASETQPLPVL